MFTRFAYRHPSCLYLADKPSLFCFADCFLCFHFEFFYPSKCVKLFQEGTTQVRALELHERIHETQVRAPESHIRMPVRQVRAPVSQVRMDVTQVRALKSPPMPLKGFQSN